MKRILSILTVALVMAAMVLAMAMPAFAEDYSYYDWSSWCPYDPFAGTEDGQAAGAACLFGDGGF